MEKIMDKIGKKAIDTYYCACKGAGKLTKEVKLKSKMAENKRKIQELYEDIGKTVYEKYVLKEEINVDRDLLNNCSMIGILADENEDIRMELLKLKDLKQCPNCHYEIYYDFRFCPNCGHVQEQTNKEDSKKEGPESCAFILTTDGKDSNLKPNDGSNRKMTEDMMEQEDSDEETKNLDDEDE